MSAVLFLDGLIAVLLVSTIIYCWKLSKKITLLHEGRHELNHFIADFNTAITRAETNISQLKNLGEQTDENLREHIQKARFLANDLSFLMDKGESVADTLENYISSSRSLRNDASRASDMASSGFVNPIKRDSSNSGKEKVARMARNIKEKVSYNNAAESNSSPSKKNMLDNVLAQIAARKKANTEKTSGTTEKPEAKKDVAPFTPIQSHTGSNVSTPFNDRRLQESLKANQQRIEP